MGLDQRHQGRQHRCAGTCPISECGDAQVDALAEEPLALAVQRLMLAELGVQDRGQQVRTGTTASNDMEWPRRLCDRLAGPAGEFLPHRLDHLVAARNALQRLGDRLAKFGERAATAWAVRR